MTYDFQFWVGIAKIVIALFAVIGFISSTYFSYKTLKELQKDRRLNKKPYLLFDKGGHQMPIEFVKRKNGEEEVEYVRLKWIEIKGREMVPYFGKIVNYGVGPAIDTFVTWDVKEIWLGKEKFLIDEKKKEEDQYNPVYNTNPIIKNHIIPNEEARLNQAPRFISYDFNKRITKAEGNLILKYKSIFGEQFQTIQGFYVFTDYENPEKGFHTTFRDIVEVSQVKEKNKRGIQEWLKRQ